MTTQLHAQLSMTERALTLRSVLDLPFIHEFSLDATDILAISGQSRLGDLNSRNVVVIDTLRALAHNSPEEFFSLNDVALSLAPALRNAATKRESVWLCAVPPEYVRRIAAIVGEDVLHCVGLGDDRDGERTGLVPIALSPAELIMHWSQGTAAQRETLKIMLEGADTLVMRRSVLAAARSISAEIIERHKIGRTLANPKVIAYLIVLLYSSLRALPVVFVPGFHGNVWLLWAIDLVTAIPYTWGIIEMVAGKRFLRRMLGLLVTVVTFVSPYIYFWFNGKDYPRWVTVFVISMIVGAILVEYLRWLRDRIVAHGFYGRLS